METNGKDNRAEARKAKRKKQVLMGKIIIAVLVLVIAALCFFLIKGVLDKKIIRTELHHRVISRRKVSLEQVKSRNQRHKK